MSRLAEIPIRVEGVSTATGGCGSNSRDIDDGATIGGGVAAILHEIASRLENLAAGGEVDAIDLRSLPMSPTDREQLLAALGPGEVTITLRAEGESTIRETDIHGVWWTELRDPGGGVIAAYIEIARVPTILAVEDDELKRGAGSLRRAARARQSN